VRAAAYRRVHGYRVVGRKTGGWVRWERWVERQFVLSLSFPPCLEVALPAAAPRILPAGWRSRPVFREGQTVETWRCIVAFDSVAAVAPSSPPPPVLSPLVYGQSDHNSHKLETDAAFVAFSKCFDGRKICLFSLQIVSVFGEVELIIDSKL